MEQSHFWSRAIILVDMNAFFASVEQLDYPEYRARAVVVTNGLTGTCIITSSYEARGFGIKTGMRLKEAKRLCPDLIRVPARPRRYAEISRALMHALQDITPDIEIFSVDEAFLDVTHCQKLHGSPEHIAYMTKEKVMESVGLQCSVGVSGDKTTAKFAAKLYKPNGLCVIPPWEAKARLENVMTTELCGIAGGIGRFLQRHGAYTCGDVAKLPISVLTRRFGPPGRRIWYMCQGLDQEPLQMHVPLPKSMGHGKVMPPTTTNEWVILNYLMHMSERLSARLRRHNMQAQHYFVGLRQLKGGWLGEKSRLVMPSHDGGILFELCQSVLKRHWQGQAVCQVQITALDPKPEYLQQDFFHPVNERNTALNQVMDTINTRFGEFSLMKARLLERSDMPNVIAPAWKPDGHRQTV